MVHIFDPFEVWKVSRFSSSLTARCWLCLMWVLQVQATVVGFLAAVAAVCLGAFSRGGVELDQAAVLCASSITTAFVAALSLGESGGFMGGL